MELRVTALNAVPQAQGKPRMQGLQHQALGGRSSPRMVLGLCVCLIGCAYGGGRKAKSVEPIDVIRAELQHDPIPQDEIPAQQQPPMQFDNGASCPTLTTAMFASAAEGVPARIFGGSTAAARPSDRPFVATAAVES